MNSLRCENLSKSFDGVHALAEVTMEFPSSGIIAIIGPNGAGKTTLLNVLTGFLQPQNGRFFFGERELTHMPPHKIAKLGITRSFQDLRLISQVSILENVLFARPNQKGEQLTTALLRFGIAAEEALASQARPVIVVTGHQRERELPRMPLVCAVT